MDVDLSALPVQDGFRLRGEAVSRLENFVDAAFAFAVTMMVISGTEFPKSTAELLLALHHVPTFAVCFLILMIFWSSHNRWSRRYGLDTRRTTILSLGLVLVVLIWIYPLRMVIGSAFTFMSGGWVPATMGFQSTNELQDCFLIYGLGFGALSAIILQLYREANTRADELCLDSLERLETRRELVAYAILVAFASLSIGLTFLLREEQSWYATVPGFLYGLIGPAMHFHHARFHKLRRQLPPRLF